VWTRPFGSEWLLSSSLWHFDQTLASIVVTSSTWMEYLLRDGQTFLQCMLRQPQQRQQGLLAPGSGSSAAGSVAERPSRKRCAPAQGLHVMSLLSTASKQEQRIFQLQRLLMVRRWRYAAGSGSGFCPLFVGYTLGLPSTPLRAVLRNRSLTVSAAVVCCAWFCHAGSDAVDDRQGQGSSISTGCAVGLWSLDRTAHPRPGFCAAEGEVTA
jgi:hypothetical protein